MRLCLRCGADPKEARKYGFSCSAWGVHYGAHLWGEWTPPEKQVEA